MKGILFKFLLIPSGLFEPDEWINIRWIIIILKIINGKIKWKVKNRFNVGFLTENPPQIHSTIICPIYGVVEIKLVITVAPQKDICPHGKTYPMKAVAMDVKKIIMPIAQALIKLYDP